MYRRQARLLQVRTEDEQQSTHRRSEQDCVTKTDREDNAGSVHEVPARVTKDRIPHRVNSAHGTQSRGNCTEGRGDRRPFRRLRARARQEQRARSMPATSAHECEQRDLLCTFLEQLRRRDGHLIRHGRPDHAAVERLFDVELPESDRPGRSTDRTQAQRHRPGQRGPNDSEHRDLELHHLAENEQLDNPATSRWRVSKTVSGFWVRRGFKSLPLRC